ncbi:sigma-70 family RNA polymerase sigma factor [bacterium]|nr:sigma-70 family RNA polymerase sigma factor [bacterium]
MFPLLRRIAADRRAAAAADHDLLRRFADGRDEAAFEAVVARHGAMVFEVCRGVLGGDTDAEDAFQATFVVLATRAGAVRRSESLAAWLHGVAYRVALKLRASLARRRAAEASAPPRPADDADALAWAEVRCVLHEELGRLPDRYRGPLVHCYLRGQTQDEAAALLGLSKGTLKRRLEGGRARLRDRLVRRGLGPSAVLVCAAWPTGPATAAPAARLVSSALLYLSAPNRIPDRVASLATGVLTAMRVAHLKTVTAAVLLGVCVLVGTGAALGRLGAPEPAPADPAPRAAPQPAPQPVRPKAPTLADGVTQMKIARYFDEKVTASRAEKVIDDKTAIADVLALFPGIATSKRPDAAAPGGGSRGYSAAYVISFTRAKGEPLHVVISHQRTWWCWSQGTTVSNGDWNLKNAKAVCRRLDELLDAPAAGGKLELRRLKRDKAGPGYTPVVTVTDGKALAEFLTLFPGLGEDRPHVPSGRGGFDTYRVVYHPENGGPIDVGVLIDNDLAVWHWSRGKTGSDGDRRVADPKRVAAFLDGLVDAPHPLAPQVEKMEVLRRFNARGELVPLAKTVTTDERHVARVLALFPEVGTDREPDAHLPGGGGGARLYGTGCAVTLHLKRGSPVTIVVSSDRQFWCWARGSERSNGDWRFTRTREVEAFLDEILVPLAARER